MIEIILAQFLPNVMIISITLVFLLLALGAKIGSGIYLNVFTLKFEFKWSIFFDGLIKGLVFGASIFAASLVASGVPIVMNAAGLMFVDGAEVLSALFPLVVLIPAIYKLLREAYVNYQKTLNVTQEDIDAMVKETTVG